ncbi:efflux RND transporter periplasmic adaptor subunit [Labrys wisconsinensis]|uniref:RND family efflux transporter MFP subunit n=1 Tax=Labrys wisconsinensis TaxID=425677 RepID=A0ABU0JK90_9HYPH|nr:efflux RND transporter periplasmic adaptor subunit [Labrys wisconsinensis]MDQ0473552.1 RND family efflux transporter MFP subunit [Labrys wisconsinensis]
MTAQTIHGPIEGAPVAAPADLCPDAAPAAEIVLPRRRGRSFWFRASGVVTGLVAVAGAGILLLARPAPVEHPAVAATSAAEAVARPPSITVVHAARGPITETAVVTGNLVPREEVLVSPQIDGYAVEDILVEEGDTVAKGQVLARLSRAMIDTSLAQNAAQIARADAAIAQAEASIAEAQASKDQTSSAFARSQTLRKDGIATADTLEQREMADRTAAARLDSAQHALTVAQADKNLAVAQRSEMMVRLARTEIKAPAAGTVSRRTARIGAIAAIAGDPLFRIIENGEIELEADVPEATLAALRPGMAAKVLTAARTEPFSGHVRLVSPEVTQSTRLGRVRISLDPAPGLTIGAFGRAAVEIASRDGVLLPQSAVLFSEQGPTVQVVRDGVVTTTPIVIGLRTESHVEIEKGVAVGDAVVATAGTFVRDGDRVTPVEPKG